MDEAVTELQPIKNTVYEGQMQKNLKNGQG
jgi:hypothetical protein